MGKRRKPRRSSKAATIEDVLAGRVSPDAKRMIDLIRSANPQGDEADATERYAVKSRLQSLFIDRFHDEIEVQPEPDQPGVVLLRHRFGAGSALHTVVELLEPDARAWVHRVLDTHEFEADTPKTPASTASSEPVLTKGPASNLLQQGQDALAVYDYDEARRLLTAAFQRAPSSEKTAVALLTLLVEHLAQYEDALALESQADVRNQTVRGLLALAAARSKQIDRALRWAAGLEGEVAAEVYAVAGQAAVAAQDEDTLQKRIEALRRADPSHPDLIRLEDAHQKLRADALAPEEAKLTAQFAHGDDEDEVARTARNVLAHWPESEVASRILAQVEQAKIRRMAEEHLLDADIAREEGDLDAEIRALERVLEYTPTDEKIRARLKSVRAEAVQRTQQAVINAMVQRLSEACDAEALLLYAELEADLRQAVRREVQAHELSWLEETGFRTRSQREAAVRAVLALNEVWALVDAEQPKPAHELLEAHAAKLAEVTSAKRARAQIESQRQAQRKKDILWCIEEIERLLNAQEWERASDLFDEYRLKEEPQAESIGHVIHWYRTVHDLSAIVDEAIRREDYIRAKSIMDMFVDTAPKGEEATWEKRREPVLEMVKIIWRPEFLDTDRSEVSIIYPQWSNVQGNILLTPDGRTQVLAQNHGRQLLVDLVDVETGRVKRSFTCRAPDNLGFASPRVMVSEKYIWLGHTGGIHLTLEVDTLEPVEYRIVKDFLPSKNIWDHFPTPGGRFSWVACTDSEKRIIHLVDSEQRRLYRTLTEVNYVGLLPAKNGCKIAVNRSRQETRLCDPSGTETKFKVDGFSVIVPFPVPSDDQTHVLLIVPKDHTRQPPKDRAALVVQRARQTGTVHYIPNSTEAHRPMLAIHERGIYVLVMHVNDYGTIVKQAMVVYEIDDLRLKLQYECDVPWGTRFFRDQYGRHLRLGWFGEEGPRIVEVSLEAPPAFEPHSLVQPRKLMEQFKGLYALRDPESESNEPQGPSIEELRQAHPCETESHLTAACLQYDACRQAGDLDGALAAIDRPIVWRSHEIYSLARLAEAYWPETQDAQLQMRRRRALVTYLGVCYGHKETATYMLSDLRVHWRRKHLRNLARDIEQTKLLVIDPTQQLEETERLSAAMGILRSKMEDLGATQEDS